jgi:FKBP-type peptidyl-prolyl cis-trans isomerase 2
MNMKIYIVVDKYQVKVRFYKFNLSNLTMSEKVYKYKVEYIGKYEDGEIFDQSPEGQPIEFFSGVGMVIKGFETNVAEMKEGESKTIEIEPEEAYGPVRKELMIKVPLSTFEGLPKEQIKEGAEIVATLETGQSIPVKIVKIMEKDAEVDFNHPLAGKKLIFELKLIEKKEATDAEMDQLNQACGGDCSGCNVCE